MILDYNLFKCHTLWWNGWINNTTSLSIIIPVLCIETALATTTYTHRHTSSQKNHKTSNRGRNLIIFGKNKVFSFWIESEIGQVWKLNLAAALCSKIIKMMLWWCWYTNLFINKHFNRLRLQRRFNFASFFLRLVNCAEHKFCCIFVNGRPAPNKKSPSKNDCSGRVFTFGAFTALAQNSCVLRLGC